MEKVVWIGPCRDRMCVGFRVVGRVLYIGQVLLIDRCVLHLSPITDDRNDVSGVETIYNVKGGTCL